MARLNIEEKLFADPRFLLMAKTIGNHRESIGIMVEAFLLAQKYWGNDRSMIPEKIFEIGKFGILLDFDLAEKRDGGIYVRGSEEHFDWYLKMKEGAQKGGKASSQRPRDEKGRLLPTESSPPSKPDPSPIQAPLDNVQPLSSPPSKPDPSLSSALTLTPALAPTPALTQKRQNALTLADTPPGISAKPKKSPPSDGSKVWDAYSAAYARKYGNPPARNARENAICSQLVQRIGIDEAVKVAEFYLTHPDRWYTQKLHPLTILLADCQKLRTEFLAGVKMTGDMAKKNEIAETNKSAIENYLKGRPTHGQ